MSEEQEIKNKAILIKHQKLESDQETSSFAENRNVRKAIVVIKKRPLVKKKVVAHSNDSAPASLVVKKIEPSKLDDKKEPVLNLKKDQERQENDVVTTSRPRSMRLRLSQKIAPATPSDESWANKSQVSGRPQNPGFQPRSGEKPKWTGRPQSPGFQPHPGERPKWTGRPQSPGFQPRSGERPKWTGRPQNPGFQPHPGERPKWTGRPQSPGFQPRSGEKPKWTGRPQSPGFQPHPGEKPKWTGRPQSPGFQPHPGEKPKWLDSTKKVDPKKNRTKKDKDYAKEKEELLKKAYQFTKKQSSKVSSVPKEIEIMDVVTVSELARKMNLKASDLISKLMNMGMFITINEQIDAETASILAHEYGTAVKIISLYEETLIKTESYDLQDLQPRSPIVTIMGHVDHGKTKLLDAIRTANITAGEYGGITQHIGAYVVCHDKGNITFLDTPGHEAFTSMRARGAQITDIVVLVVAANDGVMPQTIEAVDHAKEAKVPIIVAINKIDLPDANPEKVKQQLSEYGLIPEAWGGQTLYCEISALQKLGLDHLLDTILLQAEVLDLKTSYKLRAEGKIIESKIDQGRGIVASVIVQKGVLRVGDYFIGGVYPGKVRAMFDDLGHSVKEVGPSIPVEILGFSGIPGAGDPFNVLASERETKEISEKRQELNKIEGTRHVKRTTLANLYSTIQHKEIQELKVIVKGDVHGSVDALRSALENLSTQEIRLNCIRAAAGAIIEDDVNLASASSAIIIGFHVRPTPKAVQAAERDKVEIRKYNIIYDAVEDVRAAMEGLLLPDLQEKVVGQIEVRDIFKVSKIGVIAGCMVISGKVKRSSIINLIRDGVQIYSGKISSLRRFKDDAKEVVEGFECGISLEGYQNIQAGDVFEVIEVMKVAKKLGTPLVRVTQEKSGLNE